MDQQSYSEKYKRKSRTGGDLQKNRYNRRFIRSEYGDLSAENGVAEKDAVLKEYFPNGAGMSEIMEKHATTMDDAWVETYTLNGTEPLPI